MKLKLIFYLSLFFFGSYTNIWSQQTSICNLKEQSPNLEEIPLNSSLQCPGASVIFSDYDLSSPFTIYVNLKFHPTDAGENFSNDEAVMLGSEIIDKANELLNNMEQNAQPGPSGSLSTHVPKAKWQYKIYTENLPGDDLGGIWVMPNSSNILYNSKVIEINFINDIYNDDGSLKCFAGVQSGWPDGEYIEIYGFFNCHDDQLFGPAIQIYAQILNHEMGHLMTLEHTSYCGNQCKDIDISPKDECNPNCTLLTDCDCLNPTRILCKEGGILDCDAPSPVPSDWIDRCTWNWSNNLMAQGTKSRALTPCQWETFYNYIVKIKGFGSARPEFKWANDCTEIAPTLVIPAGSTVVWNNLMLLNRNVEVETNATLKITCEVRMAKDLTITVKKGGQLILDGGLITNLCYDEPWGGIIVEGSANESQYKPGKHGRVITKDGSMIQNAIIAVKLIDGGHISANGTVFLNNKICVEYLPYSNFWPFGGAQMGQPRDHLGGFSDCTFLWDNSFKYSKPDSGVKLTGVRGINLSGCSFVNKRTIYNPMSIVDYGYGINASDSRFRVTSRSIGTTYPPSSYDHSAFEGLGYGIYVGSSSAQVPNDNGTTDITNDDFINQPYTVQQATFSKCIYGIHNRFVSQATIVGNTFNMGTLPPADGQSGNLPFTNHQYGVYIENGANGFEFQENNFVKVENNVQATYGTYCLNTGWFNNSIRRNNYNNVEYGNIADGDNATVHSIDIGLTYICNTNTTKKNDFKAYLSSDIRRSQRDQNDNGDLLSAGNTFTNLVSPTGDFQYNTSPGIKYYYHNDLDKPIYKSPWVVLEEADVNTCNIKYCLPPCKGKEEWGFFKERYRTEKGLYSGALYDMDIALKSNNKILEEQKSAEATTYKSDMDKYANLLSLHMVYDTTSFNLDSVRIWWQNMDTPVSDMVLARDYLAKKQDNKAFSVLDAISTKYDLTESIETDLADFRAIMQIMQGEQVLSLPQTKIAQLLHFANNGTGVSAAWAKNILTVRGYHFPPMPKYPDGIEERSFTQSPKAQYSVVNPYTIAPNPAKNYVMFTRSELIPYPAIIVITDINGKKVWQHSIFPNNLNWTWETTNINSGIYFYNISDTSGIVQSGRIAIIK